MPDGSFMKALFFVRDNWDLIWFGMKEAVKGIVNPIIGFVNMIIGAVNTLIRGLNKIKITVPDWVPNWGGKTFQFKVGEIGLIEEMGKGANPRIKHSLSKDPRGLAEGGIVNRPTFAMLGERGPEAVIPLNKANTGGITINILGPTYGFDDFEDKVGEAIVDGVRRGGFSGILATG